MIHLVLLSGGSGTRLWPLSNSTRSKQFLKVLRDADGNHVSMVQRVFGQIGAVDADIDITIATCASQEESIRRQVEGGYALVLEPERRDTAPAIMLACAQLALEQGAGEGGHGGDAAGDAQPQRRALAGHVGALADADGKRRVQCEQHDGER